MVQFAGLSDLALSQFSHVTFREKRIRWSLLCCMELKWSKANFRTYVFFFCEWRHNWARLFSEETMLVLFLSQLKNVNCWFLGVSLQKNHWVHLIFEICWLDHHSDWNRLLQKNSDGKIHATFDTSMSALSLSLRWGKSGPVNNPSHVCRNAFWPVCPWSGPPLCPL